MNRALLKSIVGFVFLVITNNCFAGANYQTIDQLDLTTIFQSSDDHSIIGSIDINKANTTSISTYEDRNVTKKCGNVPCFDFDASNMTNNDFHH